MGAHDFVHIVIDELLEQGNKDDLDILKVVKVARRFGL
jgi:hypothetical protein